MIKARDKNPDVTFVIWKCIYDRIETPHIEYVLSKWSILLRQISTIIYPYQVSHIYVRLLKDIFWNRKTWLRLILPTVEHVPNLGQFLIQLVTFSLFSTSVSILRIFNNCHVRLYFLKITWNFGLNFIFTQLLNYCQIRPLIVNSEFPPSNMG
jgi:hypothetical protein